MKKYFFAFFLFNFLTSLVIGSNGDLSYLVRIQGALDAIYTIAKDLAAASQQPKISKKRLKNYHLDQDKFFRDNQEIKHHEEIITRNAGYLGLESKKVQDFLNTPWESEKHYYRNISTVRDHDNSYADVSYHVEQATKKLLAP